MQPRHERYIPRQPRRWPVALVAGLLIGAILTALVLLR